MSNNNENIASKLTTIAENQKKVFDAGKKSQYDEFWDAFQQNGNRRKYNQYAFGNINECWTNTTFKPKYDIIIEGTASMCFYTWSSWLNPKVDLKQILINQGIVLDTSKATDMTSFFAYGWGLEGGLPTIDFSSAGNKTQHAFRAVQVTTIDKIVVTTDTVYNNWFTESYKLENVVFEGTIGQDGLNMRYCTKLSKDSITSVINALSTSTSDLSVTFSETAVNKAFETSANAKNGVQSDEWKNLVNTKSNWTITLV